MANDIGNDHRNNKQYSALNNLQVVPSFIQKSRLNFLIPNYRLCFLLFRIFKESAKSWRKGRDAKSKQSCFVPRPLIYRITSRLFGCANNSNFSFQFDMVFIPNRLLDQVDHIHIIRSRSMADIHDEAGMFRGNLRAADRFAL